MKNWKSTRESVLHRRRLNNPNTLMTGPSHFGLRCAESSGNLPLYLTYLFWCKTHPEFNFASRCNIFVSAVYTCHFTCTYQVPYLPSYTVAHYWVNMHICLNIRYLRLPVPHYCTSRRPKWETQWKWWLQIMTNSRKTRLYGNDVKYWWVKRTQCHHGDPAEDWCVSGRAKAPHRTSVICIDHACSAMFRARSTISGGK